MTDNDGRAGTRGTETGKKTIEPARKEPKATGWRMPTNMNPWARAFDGETLPDEPTRTMNTEHVMLPYPDPAWIGEPASPRPDAGLAR